MVPVAIALGSNVGDATGQVRAAQRFLDKLLAEVRHSPLYWSEPMYLTDQPEFCNAVSVGQTCLSPSALVLEFKAYEAEVGRQRREPNGPREVDLDLLAYGRLTYHHEWKDGRSVHVPHPRLAERRFVIEPWAALDPSWAIPGMGRVDELLELLDDPPLRKMD